MSNYGKTTSFSEAARGIQQKSSRDEKASGEDHTIRYAVRVLEGDLEGDEIQAIGFIGKIGFDSVRLRSACIDYLQAYLNDSDDEVREAAINWVTRIGAWHGGEVGRYARAALETISDEDRARKAIVATLYRRAPQAPLFRGGERRFQAI